MCDIAWGSLEVGAAPSAFGAPEAMSMCTSSLSNTVRVAYPSELCLTVQEQTIEELSEYGEIARIDTSLGLVMGSVLVTYFDVRSAVQVLATLPGMAEPSPSSQLDFRIVSISLASFAEAVGMEGGFDRYGEVASYSMDQGEALVEYFDMRAAQRLLMAAGPHGKATPPAWIQTPWPMEAFPGSTTPEVAFNSDGSPFGFGPPGLADSRRAASEACAFGAEYASSAKEVGAIGQDGGRDKSLAAAPGRSRVARVKATTTDFSVYEIRPEQVISGEDQRTTVMVRNLTGPNARADFITFLEQGGLGERYNFFYMPCKEHRNSPAGFAFVNFATASDVLKLHSLASSDGVWQRTTRDPNVKPLAVSFARFQGEEELKRHFSSSVVMREQDPKKRPIFLSTGTDAQDFCHTPKDDPPLSPGAQPEWLEKPSDEFAVGGEFSSDDLHAALDRGAREISELLKRMADGKADATPVRESAVDEAKVLDHEDWCPSKVPLDLMSVSANTAEHMIDVESSVLGA